LTVRLAYISPSFYVDTDLSILGEMARHYKVSWYLLWSIWERKYAMEDVVHYCDKHGIDLHFFHYRGRFRHPRNLWLALRTALTVRRAHPDIIYFEGFSDPYLPFLARLLLPADSTIIGMHDGVPHKGPKNGAYRLLNSATFTLFKNFHFFSQNQHRIFLEKYPRKHSFVAGMYTKDFGGGPSPGDRNPGPVTFLFFGSIRYNKGLEFLIQAGNRLAERTSKFRVLIAGESEEATDFSASLEHPGVFDVRLGVVPNGDIPKLFSESDFLVLPYRDVTQSGPLMIAFRYGLPVIASDLPGFREYILPGETGFLFEPCNVEALTGAMEEVLALNERERREMRSRVLSYAARSFSLDTIVESYRTFFDELVG
jgi:glycosyltransferase involved in cell wall biosynthesis